MKILFLFIVSCFVILSSQPSFSSYADESYSYYAKILGNAYFYELPDEKTSLFTIPSTYFVLLIGEEGDFYKAKYLDIYGYVKKSDVTPMNGTPTSPYPNQKFRNYNDGGLTVYSSPSTSGNALGKLAFEGQYLLYGTMIGEEMFSQSTNVWYYCKLDGETSSIYGYVFSYYCDLFDGFIENTEYFPEITEELIFTSTTTAEPQGGLSDTVVAIIILSVSIPCLIILYLLLSPSKKGKLKKNLIRKKDYYEFNEDDL